MKLTGLQDGCEKALDVSFNKITSIVKGPLMDFITSYLSTQDKKNKKKKVKIDHVYILFICNKNEMHPLTECDIHHCIF